MLLLKSAEQQCLNEISASLPELLLTANINISVTSQNQLAEMIKSSVKFRYFPSGTETFVQTIIMPISLLAMAFGPYAVAINQDCGNAELTGISSEKSELLDLLMFVNVFSKYRDHATEDQFERERQARNNQTTAVPLTFSTQPTGQNAADKELQRARKKIERLQQGLPANSCVIS